MKAHGRPPLYRRVREIIESARADRLADVVSIGYAVRSQCEMKPYAPRRIFSARRISEALRRRSFRVELRREVKALAAPKKHGDAQ